MNAVNGAQPCYYLQLYLLWLVFWAQSGPFNWIGYIMGGHFHVIELYSPTERNLDDVSYELY
jgi:hypothetical protein